MQVSQDSTLELTDIARKLGIKERRKEFWEGSQVGICGLASINFRTCFDDVKHKLQDSGFPMETIQIVVNHAIIGLPKSEKLLLPILQQLKDALFDVVFGVDYSGDFESDTCEFKLFEREDDLWDVFSEFSDELRWGRDDMYYTPELRVQQKCELDQRIEQAKDKAEKASEGEKKVAPPMNISPVAGMKRCYDGDHHNGNATSQQDLDPNIVK